MAIARPPRLTRSADRVRGATITTPSSYHQRPRGVPLTGPIPAVVVETAPPGAVVEPHPLGGSVIELATYLEFLRQRGREYFEDPGWDAYIKGLAARGFDVSTIADGALYREAKIQQLIGSQSRIAVDGGTLRELKHLDKKRTYRMQKSRKNG